MEPGDDDEPEDWPPSHDAMRTLDSLLRCAVCKLVLDTPLRPACPHAFCSECLRKWIPSTKTPHCPACREPLDAQQLRTDPLLHAMADAFRKARPALLAAALAAAQPQQPAEPRAEQRRATRASQRGARGSGGAWASPAAQLPPRAGGRVSGGTGRASSPVILGGSSEDGDDDDFRPAGRRAGPGPRAGRSGSNFEECFMCQAMVRRDLLERHVNQHFEEVEPGSPPPRADGGLGKPTRERQADSSTPARLPAGEPGGGRNGGRHPPKIVLHLSTMKEMQALCSEWNLLFPGEKQKLEVLKERWASFSRKAQTSRDRAVVSGSAPDYAAAARDVLSAERGRLANSQAASLFFTGHGGAANGRAGTGQNGGAADATFDRLIADVRGRGYKGGPPPDSERGAEGGEKGDGKRRKASQS